MMNLVTNEASLAQKL